MNIENVKEIFNDYVNQYDLSEPAIKRKFDHSYRVMEISEKIARDISLNYEDKKLATIIGLLHDYGRFEQWDKYKTYSDIKSIDHADLSIEKLFENNEIKKFEIDKKYYETIKYAIQYHNKYSFPEELNDREKLFCKIIRDADKLDILYLLTQNDTKIKEDDSDISKSIKEQFYNKILIKRSKENSQNDDVVLKLAMIYDLNFEYSYKHIKDNNTIESFFETLKHKDKYEEYFTYMKQYIKERIR